ncbi:MAG: B12-binding domain-containing radical SAM protein [Elusimicrobia bacterium]|nr:B12-binding domain-containing radical SAM protein [Elusimicrobiota bacterium]
MRVLLVYPNMMGMNMLPPAIGIFTSLLKADGHQVDLFDTTNYPQLEGGFDSDKIKSENLNARPFDDSLLRRYDRHSSPQDDFARKVSSFSPDLIAMSATEDMYPIGLHLLEGLPADRPRVVLGGVFATFAPELALRKSCGMIDYVIKGEGENSLLELCRRIEAGQDPEGVPGLWMYRKDASLVVSSLPVPVDSSELPLADYGLFEESRYYRPMQGKLWRMFPVETFRGCPYTCAYCNSPSQMQVYKSEDKKYFRMKRHDKVREELRHLVDAYKADSIYFWADTFLSYHDDDFEKFCEVYSEFKLPFWIQTRPETITEPKLKRLKDIGLLRISFGVEHGNEGFREKYLQRKVPNSRLVERLRIPHALGIPFSVNNIMGFPNETRELVFDTIELNRQLHSDGINAYSFTPFKGTPLRQLAESVGLIHPDFIVRSITKPTLLNMPQFPPESIEGIRRCFVLYVKMPKSRWPEIEKAERLTPEGAALWKRLRDECQARYMNYGGYVKEEDIGMVDVVNQQVAPSELPSVLSR